MITELLGLAGSGILGSFVGMISDIIQRKQEREHDAIKLKTMQEARLHQQTIDYLGDFPKSNSFTFAFGLLCATYCLCTIICFIYPDVTILTFNPDAQPSKFSLFFFSWEIQRTSVYTISTGGVGYALLHPLAFQIGTVITGLKASN